MLDSVSRAHPRRGARPRGRLLSIAGFEPSGAVGALADFEIFDRFGFDRLGALTGLTIQSGSSFKALPTDPSFLRDQLADLFERFEIDGVKVGALFNRAIVEVVAETLENRLTRSTPLILDPLIESSGGGILLDDDGLEALKDRLAPLCSICAPNKMEAERLSGITIKDQETLEAAARAIGAIGARAVLITGGHIDIDPRHSVDLLYETSDGRFSSILRRRIEGLDPSGTGCRLSSAILRARVERADLTLPEQLEIARSTIDQFFRACRSGSDGAILKNNS